MTGARHDYTVAVDPDAINNPHSAAIRLVGTGNRVLEVGCSAGHVTRHLVARGNTVVGVELDAEAAKQAEAFAERVHVADVDRRPLSELESGPFDVIVLGDVLEHLRDPGVALADASTLLAHGGRFVISVPNVAHVDVRMMLLQGAWTYREDGLLDRTHLRWFTRESLRELLAGVGFVATAVERVRTPFGSSNLIFDRAAVPKAVIEYAAADPESNTLQYVVEARREGTDMLASTASVGWPSLDAGGADRARIAELEHERDALQAEVTAWRNSKLARGAAPLRKVYGIVRRVVGRGPSMTVQPDLDGLSETITRSRVAAVTVPEYAHPALSVVIVTYGTGSIVDICLAALEASLQAVAHEVIVVDNASGDRHGMPTAARLRLTTAGVRLITSPHNLGFGGGNEVGIARAHGDSVCLLNPDAVVAPGWAEPLLAATADRSVGIAAPVLLNPDGSVQEAGQSIDRQAITRPIRSVPDGDVVDVDYSSAACWVLRREVHQHVGGFDPIYHPAYFEDVDLAFRVHEAGFRTVLVTGSCVTHHQGESTRKRPAPALTQQAVFRRRWAARLSTLPG